MATCAKLGAFHNKIYHLLKAHSSADSLVLLPFIKKVVKVLELYDVYEFVWEKLAHGA